MLYEVRPLPSHREQRQGPISLNDYISNGWLPCPWERHSWEIYISKRERKNLQLKVFWSQGSKKTELRDELRSLVKLAWGMLTLFGSEVTLVQNTSLNQWIPSASASPGGLLKHVTGLQPPELWFIICSQVMLNSRSNHHTLGPRPQKAVFTAAGSLAYPHCEGWHTEAV